MQTSLGRNPFLKRARKENEEKPKSPYSSITANNTELKDEVKEMVNSEPGDVFLQSKEEESFSTPISSISNPLTSCNEPTGETTHSHLFSFVTGGQTSLKNKWKVKRRPKVDRKSLIGEKLNKQIAKDDTFDNSEKKGCVVVPDIVKFVNPESNRKWETQETRSADEESSVANVFHMSEKNNMQDNEEYGRKVTLNRRRHSPDKLALMRTHMDMLKEMQDHQTRMVSERGRERMKQLVDELRNIGGQQGNDSNIHMEKRIGLEQEEDLKMSSEMLSCEQDVSLLASSSTASTSQVVSSFNESSQEIIPKENYSTVENPSEEAHASLTSLAELDSNTIEKIAYFLQQQEHSLRYLRLQHATQRRLFKAFLEDASEDKLKDESFISHIEQFMASSSCSPVHKDEMEPLLEVKCDPSNALVTTCGYSYPSGSYDFALHALKEYILEYPAVFQVENSQGRKQQVVQRALISYLAFNPLANGIAARQKVVEYYRKYQRTRSEQKWKLTEIEKLLETIVEQGSAHKKQSTFIPYAQDRCPFQEESVAKKWCLRVLMDKRKQDHEFPSVDYLNQLVKEAKHSSPQMYSWYEDFHWRIWDCCVQNLSETQLFLSCLATCSPNSSLQQNIVNAMLNYRALSQGKRPRWGPYPMRSLVNYLAGALGRPSGHKVRAFLENLLFPLHSKSVTIDTHMQKIALGTGRLSLSPLEYAVLEDYFRFVSNKIEESLPHRLQSSLWSVVAGDMDYCSELEHYRKVVTLEWPFTLDKEETRTALIQSLRSILLEMGYLTRLDCGEMNDMPRFYIYIPLRKETLKSLKGHIALRRAFARKQQRQLLPQEEQEIEEYERAIQYCQIGEETQMNNPSDVKWFYRDWCQFRAYCLPMTLHLEELNGKRWELMTHNYHWEEGMNDSDHEDPYFGSHLYFEGCRDLQIVLEKGGLWK
eukprot:jgi/Galph1/368/GphlegSOOS_G5042.1